MLFCDLRKNCKWHGNGLVSSFETDLFLPWVCKMINLIAIAFTNTWLFAVSYQP